jgi:hypothetical protein
MGQVTDEKLRKLEARNVRVLKPSLLAREAKAVASERVEIEYAKAVRPILQAVAKLGALQRIIEAGDEDAVKLATVLRDKYMREAIAEWEHLRDSALQGVDERRPMRL